MASLTTHVLDTARGRPAAGMALELARLDENGERHLLKAVRTNADGRTDEPLLAGEDLTRGVYELAFDVGEYFAGQVETPTPRFSTGCRSGSA
jgi:5-hydroxyisourate hydrolase